MNSFWSVGDLCFHKTSDPDYLRLSVVEKLNFDRNVCTITSDLSKTQHQASPDELLPVTRDTIQLAEKQSLDLLPIVDAVYFEQKLDKLCDLFSGKSTPGIPRIDPVLPVKNSNSSEWAVGKLCICTWTEDENYYYATIVDADVAKDCYLVQFCHYDNTEEKFASDLHPLGSGFEMLVEDDLNREAAQCLQRNTKGTRHKANLATSIEVDKAADKCASALILDTNDDTLASTTLDQGRHMHESASRKPNAHANANRLPPHRNATRKSSAGQQPPPPPPPTHNNTSLPPRTFPPTLADLSSLVPPTLNDRTSAGQAPWQALLISWFMCGYHTGYFEALHSDEERRS